MVGGRLSCCFTYISVLLLGVCLCDVEASSCQTVFHKKVGDTVQLSSCLPPEGVVMAKWKYGESLIADTAGGFVNPDFKDRSSLNPTDFSLTLRGLTLQDSGDFYFLSAVNNKQREIVNIILQVHEPITEEPVVFSNSTWHTSNESCTVLLACTAAADSSVSYKWTGRNRTRSGSRQRYIITPQDGDTKFTCTISNVVSEKSALVTVKCNNFTSNTPETGRDVIILSVAAGGCLLIVFIVGVAVYVYRHQQSQAAGIDSNDLTVYADIADVAIGDGTSSTMKSCTLYETIENRVDTVTPAPQTIYDKIQFSRMRKASVSPYQDIS